MTSTPSTNSAQPSTQPQAPVQASLPPLGDTVPNPEAPVAPSKPPSLQEIVVNAWWGTVREVEFNIGGLAPEMSAGVKLSTILGVIGKGASAAKAVQEGSELAPKVAETLEEVVVSAKAERGVTVAASGAAVAVGNAIRLHHAWPKYLGGTAKQDLVPLSKSLHDAFHSGLDKILPRQWGTAYYESLGPAARQQLLQDLGAYTKGFDAKYGTQLYDALIRNGFPAP